MADWYTIKNIDTLDTPSLVVYPEQVSKNLSIVRSFIDDINRLRPHVKTNKCPQVVRMMLDAGIRKLKCATIAEAEMLALEHAPDVVLAYQPIGPKAARFIDLMEKFPGTTFACLVDNEKSLSELSALAQSRNATVRVYIDLNVGMDRTGIRPGEKAMALYRAARQAGGIGFLGLHAYDGHLRDADLAVRTKKCDEGFAGVEAMRKEILADSGKDPIVIAGGTPSYPIHAKRKDVEASPGTFIFWDKGYQQLLAEQPFVFAALVVTRVISVPDENTLCVDLGHKSIAPENALANRVYFLNAPGLEPIGHSEEHMVFRSGKPHGYQPGDVFYGVPHHICPTVSLYDEAAVCRSNTIIDKWPITARKRTLTV